MVYVLDVVFQDGGVFFLQVLDTAGELVGTR